MWCMRSIPSLGTRGSSRLVSSPTDSPCGPSRGATRSATPATCADRSALHRGKLLQRRLHRLAHGPVVVDDLHELRAAEHRVLRQEELELVFVACDSQGVVHAYASISLLL